MPYITHTTGETQFIFILGGVGGRGFRELPVKTGKENTPRPWRSCFYMDCNKFHKFYRESSKEHLCQMIFDLDKQFLEEHFKFPILKHNIM